jgi:hypothetical protein
VKTPKVRPLVRDLLPSRSGNWRPDCRRVTTRGLTDRLDGLNRAGEGHTAAVVVRVLQSPSDRHDGASVRIEGATR